MHELKGDILDMAKWGVCRYSLGYLDYTFGSPEGGPTFAELSHIIDQAATTSRTLHYRYTRNSSFGDGRYSHVKVDGVYKLEGDMFFQHVTTTKGQATMTRSFFRVPDIPNLRLGLSSDMNVGAPLPVSEVVLRDTIEKVGFLPYGAAQVVELNDRDVVFVDRDKDRICLHSLPTVVQDTDLRLPSIGSPTKEYDSGEPNGCDSHVSGAEHRARLSVSLPIPTVPGEPRESVFQSMADSNRWLGTPVLTREEQEWLSTNEITMGNRSTLPYHLQSSPPRRGVSASLDSMHLISKTLECIRGSSVCTELGDYAENNWPRGGTGYPIAISYRTVTPEEILVKMIVRVNHGAIRVTLPCDLKPLSLGSNQHLGSHEPTLGYYTSTEKPQVSKAKTCVTQLGPLIASIAQPLALLYCPNATWVASRVPSSEMYFQKTSDCMSDTNASLGELGSVFSQLGSLIEASVRREEQR